MKILENIRKRAIVVIIGIAGFYLIPIPTGIILHSIFPADIVVSASYYIFTAVTMSFLVVCLFIAFVGVKPSLVPQKKKYRQIIVVGVAAIAVFAVIVPLGLIVREWQQGQCIITSGNKIGDRISGTTSSSFQLETECIRQCEFAGRTSMTEEKTCEFRGMFGINRWQKTPDDFTGISGKIVWR